MTRKLFILFFVITFSLESVAGSGEGIAEPSVVEEQLSLEAIQAVPLGFNFKFSPLIYWHTLLVSVEYPLKNIPINIGVNAFASLGFDNKKDISQDERWEQPGWGIDLYAKYFLMSKIERPEGLYVQLNASYNTIVYQEGVVRPLALNNNSSSNQTVSGRPIVYDPKPFNGGGGVGYQLIIIPRNLIADIMIAAQVSQNKDGSIIPTIYILPSIGYTF